MKQPFLLLLLFLASQLAPAPLFAQLTGSPDTGFNPSPGLNDWVQAIAVQADGKIIAGGSFTAFAGNPRSRIVRLNADGTLDASFNSGTGTNGPVYSIAVQPDGKILIAGPFTRYNSISRNGIARLNTDGSLDTGFNPGTGADNYVGSVSVQPNGKIIIAGGFTNYNGVFRSRIARLNTDASLDTSFTPNTGGYDLFFTAALQADGKIVIGGDFNRTNNSTTPNRVDRLNANGSRDTSFHIGTGANAVVYTAAVQADSKILIGGSFTGYNGTTRSRIARLQADGSLDTTFNPGTGATKTGVGLSSHVYSVAVQADGKILIGGDFTGYNGTARNNLARLNADGSLDTSFDTGSGADSPVNTIVLQPDGKILIGGWFYSYNGNSSTRIARIHHLPRIIPTGIVSQEKSMETHLWPNPTKGRFWLQLSGWEGTGAEIMITDLAGKLLLKKAAAANNGCITEEVAVKLPNGIYLLKVTADGQTVTRKLVVE